MLIRPGRRDNEVIKMFAEYVHFVLTVENTPHDLISRSHEWVRGFHGAIGLSGEAGEIEQLFKKDMFGKNKSIQRSDLINELGDLLWYFVLVLDAFNITFEDLIEYNTTKLAQRYAEKLRATDDRGEVLDQREADKEQNAKIKEAEKVITDHRVTAQSIMDVFSTHLPDEEQDKLKHMIFEALNGGTNVRGMVPSSTTVDTTNVDNGEGS